MASIRKLKKDIQFLTAEGISDCINLMNDEKKERNDQLLDIIKELVAHHNTLIERAAHPDGKDNAKLIRSFYKNLRTDYIRGLDDVYKKLEGLIKQ